MSSWEGGDRPIMLAVYGADGELVAVRLSLIGAALDLLQLFNNGEGGET